MNARRRRETERRRRRAFLKAAGAAVAGAAWPGRALAADAPLALSFDGPIVSTGDLAAQRELFEGVFGLRPAALQSLSRAEVLALWGVEGRSARTVLLETPGTGVSVLLVQFEPAGTIAIREGAAGIDCDALKVVDFTLDDWERGLLALRAKGYQLAAPAAEYSLPGEGRFTEGHVKGPDSLTVALLKFHDSPRSRFVKATEPLFSEPLGVSAPVEDLGAVKAFYAALGLKVVFEYAIETDSFSRMIGAGRTSRLTGTNFGVSEKAPMIGIIHYGLPKGSYRSLRERAVLPNRGLAALRLTVRSAAEAEAACQAAGAEVVARTASARLLPRGEVRSCCVRAPHGVLHQLVERL